MLISLDNVATQVWKNKSYGNYMRGCHFLERLCLQYCSKIQLQISFFKRVKTDGQNSFHIYSLSQMKASWQNFPNTYVDYLASHEMFFSSRTGRARNKNMMTITMWYNLQEIKTLPNIQRYKFMCITALDAIFLLFDIPIQKPEQTEHLYISKG